MRAALLAVLLLSGCSLAPSDQVLEKLTSSERSWCVSVTSVYGTVRMGGSGAKDALVLCNQEGLKVDGSGVAAPSAPAASSAIIIPSAPRVFIQNPGGVHEVDPSIFDEIRRKGRQ